MGNFETNNYFIDYLAIENESANLMKEIENKTFNEIKRELFSYSLAKDFNTDLMLEEFKDFVNSDNIQKKGLFLKKYKDDFEIDFNEKNQEFEWIITFSNQASYYEKINISFDNILNNLANEYNNINKGEYLVYCNENNIFKRINMLLRKIFNIWVATIKQNQKNVPIYLKKNFKEKLENYTFIKQISDFKLKELSALFKIEFQNLELQNIVFLKNTPFERQILFDYYVTSYEFYENKSLSEHKTMISSISLEEEKFTYYSYQRKYGKEILFIDYKFIDNDLLKEIEKHFDVELNRNCNMDYNFLKDLKDEKRFNKLDIFEEKKLEKLVITNMINILSEQSNDFLIVDAEDIIDDNIGQDFIIKRTLEYNCKYSDIEKIFNNAKRKVLNELPFLLKRSCPYKLIDPKVVKKELEKLLNEE